MEKLKKDKKNKAAIKKPGKKTVFKTIKKKNLRYLLSKQFGDHLLDSIFV